MDTEGFCTMLVQPWGGNHGSTRSRGIIPHDSCTLSSVP